MLLKTKGCSDSNTSTNNVKKNIGKYFPFLSLFLVILFFSIASDRFRSITNFINITQQSAVLITSGIGVTIVILAGSIDLSVGSILGLSAVVTALASGYIGNWAIFIGPLAGILVGFFTGVVFSKGKIPSFIATLASMIIIRGIILVITNGSPIPLKATMIKAIASTKLFGFIPMVFIIAIAVYFIGFILIEYKPIGRYIKATGGEEKVAVLCGINISSIKIIIFMLSGFMTGIAGILQVSRVMAGVPTTGQNFELDVIAAVVLGGTTLSGGVGTVTGTIIGALTITALSSGLNIIGVSPYGQYIVKGLVLIVAILISIDRKKVGVIK